MTDYTPECFKHWLLTLEDKAFYERIDAFGALELAQQCARTAPKWELYQAWDVDPEELAAYEEKIMAKQAKAHTLGQTMLSNPEHEHTDGEEFVTRFNFTRAQISFRKRREKILTSA